VAVTCCPMRRRRGWTEHEYGLPYNTENITMTQRRFKCRQPCQYKIYHTALYNTDKNEELIHFTQVERQLKFKCEIQQNAVTL
jgi:hypothetical protein